MECSAEIIIASEISKRRKSSCCVESLLSAQADSWLLRALEVGQSASVSLWILLGLDSSASLQFLANVERGAEVLAYIIDFDL